MIPRVVVAGNSRAAVEVLDLLVEAVPTDHLLAIAPPRAGRHAWQPSLAEHAGHRGVRCLQPEDINGGDVVDMVAGHRADLLLSVYYTQIFRPPILGAVSGPALNFHPALLPRHRGTAPLVWAIVEGDERTGLTVHHVDDGVDTGPVIVQHPLPIHPDDTGFELHQKMALLVRATAADLLRRVVRGKPLPVGHEQVGPASVHRARDGRLNHLDWTAPAARVRNVVRALAAPLPPAYGLLDGERLHFQRLDIVAADDARQKSPGMIEFPPGSQVPWVWAGDGPLAVRAYVEDGEVIGGELLRQRRVVAEGEILA